MPKKTSRKGAARPAPVGETIARLDHLYADATCSLDFRSPLELLVATILSAQCTDARVNQVTPEVFKRYPDAAALAAAPPGALEDVIRSTGFFNAKARSLRGMAKALVSEWGGEVPRTMEALHALPGVGRKTANVVLGNVWGTPDGVVVDTHVGRIARRLGWTRNTDAVKVEQDLNRIVPRDRWTWISHALIQHGRRICASQRPKCDLCTLADICPKIGVAAAAEKKNEKERKKRKKKISVNRKTGKREQEKEKKRISLKRKRGAKRGKKTPAAGAARRGAPAKTPHASSKKSSSSSWSSSSSSPSKAE